MLCEAHFNKERKRRKCKTKRETHRARQTDRDNERQIDRERGRQHERDTGRQVN